MLSKLVPGKAGTYKAAMNNTVLQKMILRHLVPSKTAPSQAGSNVMVRHTVPPIETALSKTIPNLQIWSETELSMVASIKAVVIKALMKAAISYSAVLSTVLSSYTIPSMTAQSLLSMEIIKAIPSTARLNHFL
jgi:hypothetical protein